MSKGVRLGILVNEMVEDAEQGHVMYWLCEELGYEDANQLISTDEEVIQLKKDIEEARKLQAENEEEDDDYEEDEFSFWCSNSDGEGMVTFVQDGSGHWVEHWTDWEDYEEGSDSKPSSMRYMSYLTKNELKNYLYRDGFNNVTDIE